MPDPTRVNFAIVSDLHCRLETDPRDSFLTVGSLRSPSGRHPVESLLDLIDKEPIEADALLVPGDLSNRGCREGLAAGWDYSSEIARKLRAPIFPVIGNHDVDSHRVDPQRPATYAVRNLRPGFPFTDQDLINSFFSDGYCLLRVAGTEILAINTVIDQVDVASAKRGGFGLDRIGRMEAALQGRFTSAIRGGLMHHHPILHSGAFWDDLDVIPTGDALVAALERLGVRFIIHGHKHATRLSNVNGVAVFASGSFSAMLQEFAGTTGNTFHVFSVQGNSPDNIRGQIRTWIFKYSAGWRRSTAEQGFPFLSGFGSRTAVSDIVDSLKLLGSLNSSEVITQEHLLDAVPDIEYLTPDERARVNQGLAAANLEMADYRNGRIELWRIFRP